MDQIAIIDCLFKALRIAIYGSKMVPNPKPVFSFNTRSILKGVILGALLALCFGAVLIIRRVYQIRSDRHANIRTEFYTLPETISPTPTGEAQAILNQAEKYLMEGYEPQKAIDLLSPILGLLKTEQEQIQAYTLLSVAEAQLGHYQIAAIYAEKVHQLEPSAANLYNVAVLYDIGGNLKQAYIQYNYLYMSTDEEADEYRDIAKERMEVISQTLFTPTPTLVE